MAIRCPGLRFSVHADIEEIYASGLGVGMSHNGEKANRSRHCTEEWLGLGDFLVANEELDSITPLLRAHPTVLSVRYEIYAKAKNWDGAVVIANTLVKLLPRSPAAWINLAYDFGLCCDAGQCGTGAGWNFDHNFLSPLRDLNRIRPVEVPRSITLAA